DNQSGSYRSSHASGHPTGKPTADSSGGIITGGVDQVCRVVENESINIHIAILYTCRVLADKLAHCRAVIPGVVVVKPDRRVPRHGVELEPVPVAWAALARHVHVAVILDV